MDESKRHHIRIMTGYKESIAKLPDEHKFTSGRWLDDLKSEPTERSIARFVSWAKGEGGPFMEIYKTLVDKYGPNVVLTDSYEVLVHMNSRFLNALQSRHYQVAEEDLAGMEYWAGRTSMEAAKR